MLCHLLKIVHCHVNAGSKNKKIKVWTCFPCCTLLGIHGRFAFKSYKNKEIVRKESEMQKEPVDGRMDGSPVNFNLILCLSVCVCVWVCKLQMKLPSNIPIFILNTMLMFHFG